MTIFAKTLHSRCLTGFWICCSEYATVLNISRLGICFLFCIRQGSKYARVTEGSEDAYALLMFKYVWICQNMREYTFICLNAFVLNFFCFLSSWEYLICFLSKTKNFVSKISSLPLLLQTEGLGAQILMHTIYLWWFLMIYLSPFLCFFFCNFLLFLLLFSTFWRFRELNQKLPKALIL